MPAIRPGPLAILVVGLLAAVSRAGDATSPAQGRVAKAVTFEEQIRPILKANCFRCHGGEGEPKAGLDLRLRRLAADGGDSGPAIAPGKRGESLLYERVSRGEMPPTELKLSAAEVELIGAWIDGGAKTLGPEPEKIEPGLQITPEERSFWSFQRVPGEVAVPRPAAAERVRTPIDAFLLVELEKHGLAYSDEAAKAALYTRAHFDLLGLPPDRGELAAFVADDDPMAYERAIDRMLDSPRYGERWGRYWLDVAGYADSDGYTAADSPRPFAYKYRDYVIRALNEDKPLDRFLVEQMAGDELAPIDRKHLTPDDVERLAATGFLRMAADGTASGAADVELARNQVMADTLKIVSTSLLGLSVGCAQCHDHRYDPILQSDYYRLRAVFEPALDWKHWRAPGERLVSLWTEGERAKAAEVDAEAAKVAAVRAAKQAEFMAEALEKEIAKHDDELQGALKLAYETPGDRRTPAQQKLLDEYPSVRNFSPGVLYQYNQAAADELKKIDAQIVAIQAKKPFQDFVPVLDEVPGQLPPTFLFHRGDHQQPKGEIAPGGLSVCSPPDRPFAIPADDPARPTSGRRLALAQWLTSDANPLTARVLVNRVWLNHFGRGLVNTPADFGSLGERPSHPELLDWLARDFMAGGWRLKRLHKLIMTSTAYRQSSARDARAAELDPENRLYWRMSVRRLDAETLRDRILATSGVLSEQMFGPCVPVKEDAVGQVVVGVDVPQTPQPPAGHEAFRRSIYIQVRRSQPLAMLHAFDQPVMETNCERRTVSTVATQSLMLMNSDFILEQAKYFAARVRKLAPTDPRAQVEAVWQLAFARAPEASELETALAFLAQQGAAPPAATATAAAPPAAATAATPGTAGAAPAAAPAADSAEPAVDPLASLCQVLLSTNEFLYVE